MERTKLATAWVVTGGSGGAYGGTRNTFSKWECGRVMPYPIHVHRLCQLFGATWQEAEMALSLSNASVTASTQLTTVSRNVFFGTNNPLLLTSPSLPPPPSPTPDPLSAAPAVQIRSSSSRPFAHHPWRRTGAQKDGAKW